MITNQRSNRRNISPMSLNLRVHCPTCHTPVDMVQQRAQHESLIVAGTCHACNDQVHRLIVTDQHDLR